MNPQRSSGTTATDTRGIVSVERGGEGDEAREDEDVRCDQCKHWNRKSDDNYHVHGDAIEVGLGQCAIPKPFWDATEWNKDGKRVMSPEFDHVMIFAQDGSDYMAVVLTRPHFFCAHFEAAQESKSR